MVIHNLNLKCIRVYPTEADAPLIVDPNTVLPRAIAAEGFQMIAWDRAQVRHGRRRVDLVELPLGHSSNPLKPPAELAPENLLGLLIPERANHNARILPLCV
jgi:hypothetical protein